MTTTLAADVRRIRHTGPYLVSIRNAVMQARWEERLRRLPDGWSEVDYTTATSERDGLTLTFHVEWEGGYIYNDEPWEPYGFDEALETARGWGMARGPAHDAARAIVAHDAEMRERAESVCYMLTVAVDGLVLGRGVLGDTVDRDDMYVLESAVIEHADDLYADAVHEAREGIDGRIGDALDTVARLDAARVTLMAEVDR